MLVREDAPAVVAPKNLVRSFARNQLTQPSPALMQRESIRTAIGPVNLGRSGSDLSEASKLAKDRTASNPPPLLPRSLVIVSSIEGKRRRDPGFVRDFQHAFVRFLLRSKRKRLP